MFDNLQRAFRHAVDNFKTELSRDNIPEAVGRLLKGMEEEVTSAKVNLSGLKSDLEDALNRSEAQAKEAATCHRREEQARNIGDDETATIAADYREKHLAKCKVFGDKANALKAEIELREREVKDMLSQLKEARLNRAALTAQAGRTVARETLQDGNDLFSELDRMAGKISGSPEPLETDGGLAEEAAINAELREGVIDARLEELKRRMDES